MWHTFRNTLSENHFRAAFFYELLSMPNLPKFHPKDKSLPFLISNLKSQIPNLVWHKVGENTGRITLKF